MSTQLTSTLKSGGFASVFTEVSHNAKLAGLYNAGELHLYHLAVSSNRFDYRDLTDFLEENLDSYVYSRSQIEQYETQGRINRIVFDAAKLLKGVADRSRLAGEMLLYIMLEHCLKAPKIMSKVELIKSSGDIKSVCDGMHLLGDDPSRALSIVFGASEVHANISDAIDEGFERICRISSHLDDECRLAETMTLNTPRSIGEAQQIKDLLVPRPNAQPQYEKDFALFLGYDLGLSRNYLNSDYRDQITQKMQLDIGHHADYIAKKIKDNSLANHSFYIYFLPFDEVDKDVYEVVKSIFE